MKHIKFFLCASLVAFSATSCSDFLEEDNKTGETADLTYNTVTGIDGLVSSAYAYCRGWWGKEPSLGLTECGTDLWYYGIDNRQPTLMKYQFDATSLGFGGTGGTPVMNDNPCLDQYWELFYAGIDVCNNTMKFVPQNTLISDQTKNTYMGDAHFLRALYYSQLVATFGPIPYNSEPISVVNTNPVREPEAVIYKNILDDLKTAMDYFQKAKVMNNAQVKDGRANYYSAKALYARVALYAASWLGKNSVEGYGDLYQEAYNAADDVITKSEARMYEKTTSTWNLENEDFNKNKENLFAVHYWNNTSSGFENCVPYRYSMDGDKHGEFNGQVTRNGYGKQGGNVLFLMWTPCWNNGCDDIGNNKAVETTLFIRCTNAGSSTIPSKMLGGTNITIDKYYSPYACGYTRWLPSLYLWTILDEIKDTDQRYNATLLTSYNVPYELTENSKNYPNMKDQQGVISYDDAWKMDGNYFRGGYKAIAYSLTDPNSPEGKAEIEEAKGKYRLQFAFGGDIPVYTSSDMALAEPTTQGKAVSDVYGDARYNNAKIGGHRSFPGVKKFLDDQFDKDHYSCATTVSHRDFMVLRLSEMYLIKAEAQMYTGGDALATLNELRTYRAIPGKEEENKLTGAVTIETILKERALELCGEYQRWFDLKRTHKLVEYVQARNHQSRAISLKHYYRPIPESQMQACTNVTTAAPTQDANGVLQYSATAEGFWQNPGF